METNLSGSIKEGYPIEVHNQSRVSKGGFLKKLRLLHSSREKDVGFRGIYVEVVL